MNDRRPRVVLFSCAGAPLGAEVLQAIRKQNPACLDAIVAVVLSRPAAKAGAARPRPSRCYTGPALRHALAYRRRRALFTARRRLRAVARLTGLGNVLPWRRIEDFSDDRRLPVLETRDAAAPGTLRFVTAQDPDLVVMITFHHILREPLIAAPRDGVYNVHCSLLPAFRGPDPIGAALAAGERRTGVSVHRVDTGVDTGEVIAQRTVDIAGQGRDPVRLRRRLALAAAEPVMALLRSEATLTERVRGSAHPSADAAPAPLSHARSAGTSDQRQADRRPPGVSR
ncbi:formyltransferase family protein [Arhodomonas sp. SL1]|uniref:formyltransferase family protein n=1 Tax=Arhodomonas sp. SL1 TaxID=3425691 RepID=UPI003F880842